MRGLLVAAGYHYTQRLPAFTSRALAPLQELATLWHHARGTLPPLSLSAFPPFYLSRLARDHPEAAELYRLFFLHQRTPLRPNYRPLQEAAMLRTVGREVESLVQVACVYDTYILSSVAGRSPGEYVYLGDDSAHLCRLTRNLPPRGRALDLCCGCGVIALTLPDGYTEVVGLDLNPTAIRLARSNALLAGSPARFVESDLWQAAEGEFDLVVGNPPALPILSSERDLRFAAGGPALTHRAVEGLGEHLARDGRCLLLTFGAHSLFEEVDARLGPDFSLLYRVRQEFWTSHGRLDHVLLDICRDGKGRRRRSRPSVACRLAAATVPWPRPSPTTRAGLPGSHRAHQRMSASPRL